MRNLSVKNLREVYIWLSLSIALIALAALLPFSGDDWQWGVTKQFEAFNGRYIGNLSVRLLTQVLWLRPFVIGLTISAIMFAVVRITSSKNILPTLFLMILMPTPIFTQVVQWTSGFCNFTISVLLILANLLMLRHIIAFPKQHHTLMYIAAFALAFATQLFVEHITVFTVGISLIYLLYCRHYRRPETRFILCCLVGYAAGAITMFQNPCYWEVNVMGAHNMPMLGDMLSNAIYNYFCMTAPYLILDNLWLNLLLCLILIRFIKATPSSRLSNILITFFHIFLAYCAMRAIHPLESKTVFILFVEGILALIYCAALITTVLKYINDQKVKHLLYFAIGSLVIINLPLLVVKPLGPRCFFISYVIFIITTNILLNHLLSTGVTIPGWSFLRKSMLFLTIIAFFLHFYIYSYTYIVYKARQQNWEQQIAQGAQTITIEPLPFSKYVWFGDPSDAYLATIFKNYYGIPQEYEIELQK